MPGVVTINESRERDITVDGVSADEITQWIVDGLAAAYADQLPADFALDADDTMYFFNPGQAGTPTVWSKANSGTYRFRINETD